MFKFFKQKNSKRACPELVEGFTLVETLVALSIFVLGVLAMLVVLSSGIESISSAKNRRIATYLAQEGIEYTRNFRDTYFYGTGQWTNLYSDLMIYPRWHFDYLETSFSYMLKPCVLASPNYCPFFYLKDGRYNYDSSGEPTPFVRVIKFEPIGSLVGGMKVTSTVSWGNQSVSLSENLYDWID